MKINKQEIEEWLKLVKTIRKNLYAFTTNVNELNRITTNYNFYGINNDMLDTITDKYEFRDLIIENGDIYVITQRFEQTSYQENIGVREYIAKRLKWNLELDSQEYDIEEEMIFDEENRYDFSVYHIKEKE